MKAGCCVIDKCDKSDHSQGCLYDSDSSGLGTGSDNSETGQSEQRLYPQSVDRSGGALQKPPPPWCRQELPPPPCRQDPPTPQASPEVHRGRLEEEGGRLVRGKDRLHEERGRLEGELGRISGRLNNMEEQLAKVGSH